MKKSWGLINYFLLVGVIVLSFGFSCKGVAATAPNDEQTKDSAIKASEQVFNEGMTVKGPTAVEVGDKGTFEIQVDYAGVPFDGKYVFYYDESRIIIDAQGNWEALKAGKDTIAVAYGYIPSEKMLNDLKVYFGGDIPAQKDIAKTLQMKIAEKAKSPEMEFNEGMVLKGPTEVEVGDKGTFDIQVDYGGVPFDGKYVFYYDESLIKIDAQGNWEALKAGKVDIVYGYIPSEKMLSDLKKHFGGDIPSQEEIAKAFQLTISEKQKNSEMVFNVGMDLRGPSVVEVGDKGKFDIRIDYEGIPFDGKYVFNYDKSLIKVDEQGNWEALKSGKVNINFGYLPSKKMLVAIEKHFGGEIPPQTATALIHPMYITDNQMIFNEGMTLNGPTSVEVGDKGKFGIKVDYEGIPFDGKYVFNYDESLIKVDAQGNWEALKAGEVDITFGYLPSKKMLEDIMNHFGGEIPPQKEIAKIHKMLISEKAVQQTQPIQTSASTTKQYPVTTSKQLPRTGERKMSIFIYLGAFITVFASWLIARNRRVSK